MRVRRALARLRGRDARARDARYKPSPLGEGWETGSDNVVPSPLDSRFRGNDGGREREWRG